MKGGGLSSDGCASQNQRISRIKITIWKGWLFHDVNHVCFQSFNFQDRRPPVWFQATSAFMALHPACKWPWWNLLQWRPSYGTDRLPHLPLEALDNDIDMDNWWTSGPNVANFIKFIGLLVPKKGESWISKIYTCWSVLCPRWFVLSRFSSEWRPFNDVDSRHRSIINKGPVYLTNQLQAFWKNAWPGISPRPIESLWRFFGLGSKSPWDNGNFGFDAEKQCLATNLFHLFNCKPTDLNPPPKKNQKHSSNAQ